jgi:alpha-D-xyloside xylohydrolase
MSARIVRVAVTAISTIGAIVRPVGSLAQTAPHAAAQPQIVGDLVDISEDFEKPDQLHFVGRRVTRFDPATGVGLLQWERYTRQPSYSFNKMDVGYSRADATEFPGTEYDRDPALPFEITFVSPRTVRLRFFTRDLPPEARRDTDSLMLAPRPATASCAIAARSASCGSSGIRGTSSCTTRPGSCSRGPNR